MKILITTDWYTPAVNGVVTSVKNLQRELERRGHEVRILTLSQSLHSWSRDGVTAIGSVNAGRIYPGARLRTAMAGRWVRELMDWRPDVVHSQCEFSTFFLARRIAEELDIPLVHTYHTVYEDYTHYFSPSVRWGRCAVAAFSRWVAAQVDGMIAPTGKVRGLLQGYGVRCPVFVVPTGIDLRRFQQEGDPMRRAVLRASLRIPAENTVLVCVGRLAEEKNIQELLKLRASLGSRPVTLLLVGDGPDRPRLEQVAHDLRLEAPAVIFAGMVPPEEVPEWYRLGDLFVSASSSETQGLTYIEALAAGVPAEDARYLLPNAAETKIVITMNVRELLHFFSLRCCNRAQWEIREMAHRMLELAKPTAPFVFMDAGAPCIRGNCPEGKMTCGNPYPRVTRG